MHPLIVVSIDAMVTEDLRIARQFPTLDKILQNAAILPKIKSIFPTLTYPCHVSQLTGNSIAKHGVINNEIFDCSKDSPDWIWNYDAIQTQTILDVARQAGLKTGIFMWPVTANAPADYLVPEIWVKEGKSDAFEVLGANSSPIMTEKYLKKNLHHIEWNNQPLFDDLGVALTLDVLENEEVDLLFLHLSCVDISRHKSGLFSDQVTKSIGRIDQYLGQIIQLLDQKYGDGEYNLVLISDHGHRKVYRQLNLNVDLREHGLYREGTEDYGAYISGAGLAAFVNPSNPEDAEFKDALEKQLYQYLSEPRFGVDHLYTLEECRELFDLDGDFSYCLISDTGTAFKNGAKGRILRVMGDPDFEYASTGHGHLPELGIQPVFVGVGPSFQNGIYDTEHSILDEAPTFAHLLNLTLPYAEGRVMTELLRL